MRAFFFFMALMCSVSCAHASPQILFPGDLWDIPAGWHDNSEWFAVVPANENERKKLTKSFALSLQPYEIKTAALHIRKYSQEEYEGREYALEGEIKNAVFYISGLPLRNGQIIASPYLYDGNRNLRAGESKHLRYISGTLAIGASGNYNWDSEHKRSLLSNYVLRLQWRDQAPQIIMESEFFDDAIPGIIWNGDLNSDGVPDVLLNLSTKYSMMDYQLWLSKKSGDQIQFYHACSFTDYSC